MSIPTFNPDYIVESIRLSVAPVFLLTAVAAMLGTLTQRLARIIDRSRALQEEIMDEFEKPIRPSLRVLYDEELVSLSQRANCVNISMVLLTLCAILIGATILELFFAETIAGHMTVSNIVLATFVGGIATFIFALVILLIEVLIASYSVRMKAPARSMQH